MKDTYLLKTQNAQRLYREYTKDLPIIDFHNHLSLADVASDRRFETLTELWVTSDPYKHRLMRICGVPERYITGDATDYEKFEAFCTVFPRLVGNPVYDWSRMELSQLFGIEEVPCKENAGQIYETAGKLLHTPEYSHNAILAHFHVEYQSPVASLLDDLSLFDGVHVAPSLRGDNLLTPTTALIADLQRASGRSVTDLDSYLSAIEVLLDRFAEKGCRFGDHSLDAGFVWQADDGKNGARFAAVLTGNHLNATDALTLSSLILKRLGTAYAKRKWTLLLHMGAKRRTSERLLHLAGPAGGYAAVGGELDVAAIADLLGAMESAGGLPETVLFPLNMSHQAALAVMEGSFSEDGVAAKVQLGPAWWWCDHAYGIRNTLSCIASFGVLSQFIGMTTDSRSVLSFVRHDYFRRLLCSWIDEQNEKEDWGLSYEAQGEIVQRICYQNALDKINRK